LRRAVIAVRDTGPGIAAQHLPRLFEPFYRVDAARGGSHGHAGLGLALADWIVRAHGGHLSVESRVGVGTVFTLSLPLRARPTPGRQPT
jgi:signal transduction histidine kinase